MERQELRLVGSASVAAKSTLNLDSLLDALELRALPWIQQRATERMVVPRATFKEMVAHAPLPEGVSVEARPLRSRRVVVRDRPSGFQIVSARWPEDGIETKRFPMIGCIISGRADLRINNYLLRCEEGHFIFLAGNVPHPDGTRPHREDSEGDAGSCDILWFCPMGDVLKCWICRSENGKHTGLPTVFLKRKNLCQLCDAMMEELEDPSPVRGRIRQGLMLALISSVQHEIEGGRYFRWLPEFAVDAGEEEVDPIKRSQNYIRQHLSDALTLEIVARHCFMSRSQFARIFHERTGQTFNDFVTHCRLEEAKLRLTTTTAQVAGIARHVGLKTRHFNELIRVHTGTTPSNYRRQNRDESNSW